MARALARDCDVHVVTSNLGEPPHDFDEPFTLTALRARVLLERPIVHDFLPILREIRAADAVHIHTPYPGMELLAAFLAKVAGKRVVVTYHMDAISAHAQGNALGGAVERLYDRLSLRPALRMAAQVATNSLLYIGYSRVLPHFRAKTVAMHQGIRDDRAKPADGAARRVQLNEALGIDPTATVFLFVGRLVEYKGLHVGIPAFAQVMRRGLDAHLVIGGKGPERARLEAAAREHGVEGRVHFIGFVEDEDLPRLLAAADVVISPSVSPLESTPITLLEAMAQGTAVIGSDVGGTAETVPPGGLNRIVPGSDVDSLATAMEELGRLARESAKEPRYPRTWTDVADDYLALLVRRGRT